MAKKKIKIKITSPQLRLHTGPWCERHSCSQATLPRVPGPGRPCSVTDLTPSMTVPILSLQSNRNTISGKFESAMPKGYKTVFHRDRKSVV